MTLKIIGAGLGRTGTTSQQEALNRLGLGPCYHFDEVLKTPGHDKIWFEAVHGTEPDWDVVFQDFPSTVDWPACHYWDVLARHYPEAKVLLSVRDFDSWYDSIAKTLYPTMTEGIPEADRGPSNVLEMARIMVLEQMFQGRFDDRAAAKTIFEAWHEKIIATIAPERLLVYQVSEGWAPLCKFFDKPVPTEPFPKKNTKSDYLARWG